MTILELYNLCKQKVDAPYYFSDSWTGVVFRIPLKYEEGIDELYVVEQPLNWGVYISERGTDFLCRLFATEDDVCRYVIKEFLDKDIIRLKE